MPPLLIQEKPCRSVNGHCRAMLRRRKRRSCGKGSIAGFGSLSDALLPSLGHPAQPLANRLVAEFLLLAGRQSEMARPVEMGRRKGSR